MSASNSVHKRNDGMDLLRIVAMFAIVLHHCSYHGLWRGSGQTWGLVILFTLFLQWHVDCFVAISGWFGIKFSWRKWFSLWSVVLFYSIMGILYGILFHRHEMVPCHFLSQGGWFTHGYFILLFLAPLINEGVDAFVSKSRKTLFAVWLTLFAAFFLNWAPYQFFTCVGGEIDGFSAMNMLFVYTLVRVVSKMDVNDQRKARRIIKWSILASIIVAMIWFLIERKLLHPADVNPISLMGLYSYAAPYSCGIAVILVCLFSKCATLPKRMSCIVGFIAPSMFGVYLCHEASIFGHPLICSIEDWVIKYVANKYLVICFSAVIVFCVSIAIDAVRRALANALLHRYRANT